MDQDPNISLSATEKEDKQEKLAKLYMTRESTRNESRVDPILY